MAYTEADHLNGKDEVVRNMYTQLIAALKNFGDLKIDPKKTSIHLGNRFGFAGVFTRNFYINLELHLNYKINSDRVSKVEQASANSFHHTIKLSAEKEIDQELLGWLKEAYDFKAHL
jgi:hypothetical protein